MNSSECDTHRANSHLTRREFSFGAATLVLTANPIADPSIVSEATIRNWERLGTERVNRLASRANKRMSRKNILPVEYFKFAENAAFARHVADFAAEHQIAVKPILFSLAKSIFERERLISKSNVRKVLAEVADWGEVDLSPCGAFQDGEPDLLGGVYQTLLHEGKRNENGIYYTRMEVARAIVEPCSADPESLFLDPCCGSGSVLCAIRGASPENLYGIDIDPIAVFLAKVNLIRKYPDIDFSPRIYCLDFLSTPERDFATLVGREDFDNVVTNPPWGAVSNTTNLDSGEITSHEIFSLFYVRAFKLLKKDGAISFLLPQAMMNVAIHRDLRAFVLTHGRLCSIAQFDKLFSGVTTKYVLLFSKNMKSKPSDEVLYSDFGKGAWGAVSLQELYQRADLSLQYVDKDDNAIISKIKEAGPFSLSESLWALGVVTGDNKRKLKDTSEDGYERIYTGKEVQAYRFSPPRRYIRFDRQNMQQAAKDEYYRAKEKLVYRFIADRPVFAYDATGAITLNSANILIPRIEGMSVKTVAAFLNSDVLVFFYKNMCGGTKVLKSHLCKLPFPSINKADDDRLSKLVDSAIAGDESAHLQIQSEIYRLYNLTEIEKQQINRFVYGKTS